MTTFIIYIPFMKISFNTKEESNKIREVAFLKLSKEERVSNFFHLVCRVNRFPTKAKKKNNDSFIIVIPE